MFDTILPYHPNLVLRKINTLYFTRLGTETYNPDGVDIFEENWDNLIILDACRYDQFDPEALPYDEYETKISRGSNTSEFLKGNCTDRQLEDVVYVTASPIYYYHREEINASFHEVINVWSEDGWDQSAKTVLPETVEEYAADAAKRFPHKRLLIHFIQPHYPFIESETEFDKKHLHADSTKEVSFWREMNTGKLQVPTEELRKLFNENLERTVPHVRTLMSQLQGRTVVTADHCNLFGELVYPFRMRHYGHPPKLYTEPLVKVPWLVNNQGDRKRIVSGDTAETDDAVDETTVKTRLEDLGYIDL